METMGQAAETGLRRVARNQAEYARLRLYTWLWAFGVAGVTLALLFTVWLFGVQVRDSGMAPAIEPGDVILFDRLAKYFQSPARGDIVAFSDAAGERTRGGSWACRVKRWLFQAGACISTEAFWTSGHMRWARLRKIARKRISRKAAFSSCRMTVRMR